MRVIGVAAVCLGAVICFVALSLTNRTTKASPIPLPATSMASVMTVNGQKVPVREFMLFVAQDRADVIGYFLEHYHATVGAEFWTTDFGGTTPKAKLLSAAASDATSTVVQQQAANTRHLATTSDYAAFLKAWTAENQRRREALVQHEAIYGPQQYTESQYFTYTFGNLTYSLEQSLISSKVIQVTTATERAYYNAHRTEFAGTAGAGRATAVGPTAVADGFTQVQQQVKQVCEDAAYASWAASAAHAAKVSTSASVLDRVPIS